MHELPKCHICRGRLLELSGYPVELQVTSDCRPWVGKSLLAFCAECGAVQKPITDDWRRQVHEIYSGYAVYEQGGGVEQASFNQDTGASSARSHKIVAWLQSVEPLPKTGVLLDIGCGNGAFLRAFGSSNPGWRMEGLELSSHNQDLIESIPGVAKLHVGSPGSLQSRFDLIVLIHALEHIPDPISYLRSLTGLLNPGGRILIQVPDLQTSPFDILIADHCTHFSGDTLRRVVGMGGFDTVRLDNSCVAKESTLMARQTGVSNSAGVPLQNMDGMATALAHIEWLQKLVEQGRSARGRIGVFGTSISGTWMAAVLGSKVSFFVDEDRSRSGREHLGRPIYSPAAAPKDALVLMPLRTDIAAAVARRLAHTDIQLTIPPEPPSQPSGNL